MPQILNSLIKEIATALTASARKLAVAESCTGGGLAYHLTDIPGSSAWFERGFVTYSNQAKEDMLSVNHQTLSTYGAVSEQTAREMAEGVLLHSQAQISIAITGIAGPDGGTPDKPVGTVWFAWSHKNSSIHTKSTMLTLQGNRQEIREQAIRFALETLSQDL